MARGDHVYVRRNTYRGVSVGWNLYVHHAVDVGDGTVIEYVSGTRAKRDSVITRRSLADFAQGGRLEIRHYGNRLDPDETVRRAESWLGKGGYDFFTNNCEHFATWCVTGSPASAQIENGVATATLVGTTTIAPSAGVELVGNLGTAAVRSGPNLMSGLARVGGTAVGGVTVLAGVSGLAASGVMCYALRDKPALPDQERDARRVGREASFGGAGLGTIVAVGAIGALGVPGYSAVGISSGLAAVGRVTGGGMVRGLSTSVLIPALFAVLLGYLVYRHAMRHQRPLLRPALVQGG
jgi:hypothetical protein